MSHLTWYERMGRSFLEVSWSQGTSNIRNCTTPCRVSVMNHNGGEKETTLELEDTHWWEIDSALDLRKTETASFVTIQNACHRMCHVADGKRGAKSFSFIHSSQEYAQWTLTISCWRWSESCSIRESKSEMHGSYKFQWNRNSWISCDSWHFFNSSLLFFPVKSSCVRSHACGRSPLTELFHRTAHFTFFVDCDNVDCLASRNSCNNWDSRSCDSIQPWRWLVWLHCCKFI